MKLTDEVLDEGRALIAAADLAGLMAWVRRHAPLMRAHVVRDTYRMIFQYGDVAKGLQLFNKVFPGYDPQAHARRLMFQVAALAVLFFGALGGVVYLFRACTGL